jgi:alkanesulfonate monooxygenase SsuD/methylene tetrahydromethanopterin reductase-like flavin-dependent oxidoreductase (luciferase family)
MEFGVFDHIDHSGQDLRDFYESRLKMVEAYDRAGFYCYHVAEHHGTPLGMAPSPSIMLAAAIQRTKRIKIGPLVYILPLYNPLRLIDEIAMLDQMSNGRFQLGVGRGTSPLEAAMFNHDHSISPKVYAETLDVILKGLSPETAILNHDGEMLHYKNVPMELKPLQKPYPPVWIGGHSTDGAARTARMGANYVTQDTAEASRPYTDSFRAAWKESQGGKPLPKVGLLRFIVVGDTDAEAEAIAQRAYPKWHDCYDHLFRKAGLVHERGEKTGKFETAFGGENGGVRGIHGSPQTVTRKLQAQAEIAGVNYLVGQFAFGDVTDTEVIKGVELFQRHVMPALKDMNTNM